MSMVNNILGYSETKKAEFLDHDFYTYEHLKFHAQLSWEKLINSEPDNLDK